MIERRQGLENAWKDAKHQAGWRIKCETSPTMQLESSMTASELWISPDAKAAPSSQPVHEKGKHTLKMSSSTGRVTGTEGAGKREGREPESPPLVGTLAATPPKDGTQAGRESEQASVSARTR